MSKASPSKYKRLVVANATLDAAEDEIERLQREIARLTAERDEARDWVRKLVRETQTLTCVYCGHAYPPGTPTHSADVLTAHIAECPKHPVRALAAKLAAAREALARHVRAGCPQAAEDLAAIEADAEESAP